MARVITDPGEDDPGTGDPGDPGYTPPTTPGAVMAAVTTNSAITFTEDQIVAAGGPWASFTTRVTPVNDYGNGPYAEEEYPAAP